MFVYVMYIFLSLSEKICKVSFELLLILHWTGTNPDQICCAAFNADQPLVTSLFEIRSVVSETKHGVVQTNPWLLCVHFYARNANDA